MVLRLGVLALQGGFAEHIAHLKRSAAKMGLSSSDAFEAVEVRTAEELRCCDGLIIPGGESTAMALIAEEWKLFEPLRAFVAEKPVWGTCAGMIFLANGIHGSKIGGQTLVGGIDVTVHRNIFGRQISSFETVMATPDAIASSSEDPAASFRGVFIRAPAILLDPAPPASVETLAVLELSEPLPLVASDANSATVSSVAVAARQGHILVTAFHPELTEDTCWHSLFIGMARDHAQKGEGGKEGAAKTPAKTNVAYPASPLPLAVREDLPIFA